MVLGIGAALIGSDQAQPPAKATREASASGGFVVINGWVLPSQYFRDGQA
ncbi:hypothetical protein [Pseudomonas sp. UFMG81]|nr:hypothetical protein [Pseudomonas sp. UFMG81]